MLPRVLSNYINVTYKTKIITYYVKLQSLSTIAV